MGQWLAKVSWTIVAASKPLTSVSLFIWTHCNIIINIVIVTYFIGLVQS